MKKILTFAFIASVAFATYAEPGHTTLSPSKTVTTKNYGNIGKFTEIEASRCFTINYKQASASSLSITAPDNIIQYISIDNDGGCLDLSFAHNVDIKGDCNIIVNLSSPYLTSIDLSAACKFSAASISIPDKSFEIDLSGTSSVNIQSLTASSTTFDLTGASNVTLGNLVNSRNTDIDISGASNVKITSAKSPVTVFDVSGASKTNINQLDSPRCEFDVSGASTVTVPSLTASNAEFESCGAAKIIVGGKCTNAELEASGAAKIDASALSITNGSVDASGGATIKAKIKNVTSFESSGGADIVISK